MAAKSNSATQAMVKSAFEALAEFRYRLRLFLRFSEDACNASGITPLQYCVWSKSTLPQKARSRWNNWRACTAPSW